MTDKIPAVYAAIAKVQLGLSKEGITKSRKNHQQGYNFRGIDDIYNALSGLLAEAGLCILPRVLSRTFTERETQAGKSIIYAVVDVEFDLVAASDGSRHTIRTMGEAMDSGDKATNKAMSAAYKYAALMTFAIPTEGDNDTEDSNHELAPSKPPAVITPAQWDELDHLLDVLAGGRKDAKKEAELTLLKHCGVPRLEDLPAARFASVHAGISKKIKDAQAKAGAKEAA